MAQPSRLLIVEDDRDLNSLLKFTFENGKEPFECLSLFDGNQVLEAVDSFHPNLVLLDVMLPGVSGLDVLKKIKSHPVYHSLPVVLLTARSHENDRVEGFELGADDYVTKPFSPKELVLRVNARLRLPQTPLSSQPKSEAPISSPPIKMTTPMHQIQVGPILITPEEYRVTLEGVHLNLTQTEYQLLLFLCERPGKIQSREALLQKVWGYEGFIHTRTVDTHVKRLRQKLGTWGHLIETVHGFGYQLLWNPTTPSEI